MTRYGATENLFCMSNDNLWRLEPHVCRKCFARLASRPVMDAGVVGQRVYQCTNCGTEAQANSAEELCCCGIKIKKPSRTGSKAGGTLVDAGVRCVPNPEVTTTFPSLYVASEVMR